MLRNLKFAAIVAVAALAGTAAQAEYLWVKHGVQAPGRWGPGKLYPIENYIYSGTRVKVIKRSHGWTKVYVDGVRCWVYSGYLTPWGIDYSKHYYKATH